MQCSTTEPHRNRSFRHVSVIRLRPSLFLWWCSSFFKCCINMANKTDLWLLKYALNVCIWIMLMKKKKKKKKPVGPPSSGFLWQLANKQKGACPPPTELECGSLPWDLIDRCVPFQIMSNQLNWPQVDSNRVVEINQGWSVETQCVWAPFWVSWLRLWVLEFFISIKPFSHR